MIDSIIQQNSDNASFEHGRKWIGDKDRLVAAEKSIQYVTHHVVKGNSRITFRDGMFDAARFVGEAFCLYVYMTEKIVRPNSRRSWCGDVTQYYRVGLLPFAMHQTNIARNMGTTRQAINRWLRTLVDCNLVVKLDSVLSRRGNNDIYVDVYSLGHWYEVRKDVNEYVFYAEEFRPELMTDRQATKRYERSKC